MKYIKACPKSCDMQLRNQRDILPAKGFRLKQLRKSVRTEKARQNLAAIKHNCLWNRIKRVVYETKF